MTNSNQSCWPTSASRTATPWLPTRPRGGYAGLRKVLAEMTPAASHRNGQGQQSPRPRRGRLSDRAEMVLSAQGPSRPDLHVHQCRRERAGHVQQPHFDGRRSPSGARRDHHQLLRHAGENGLHLSPLRIPAVLRPAASGHRRAAMPTTCWARTSWARNSRSTSICIAAPRPTSAAKRPG